MQQKPLHHTSKTPCDRHFQRVMLQTPHALPPNKEAPGNAAQHSRNHTATLPTHHGPVFPKFHIELDCVLLNPMGKIMIPETQTHRSKTWMLVDPVDLMMITK